MFLGSNERREGKEAFDALVIIRLVRRAFGSPVVAAACLCVVRSLSVAQEGSVKSSINTSAGWRNLSFVRPRGKSKQSRRRRKTFPSDDLTDELKKLPNRLTNYLNKAQPWDDRVAHITKCLLLGEKIFSWFFPPTRTTRFNGWDNQWRLSHKSRVKSKRQAKELAKYQSAIELRNQRAKNSHSFSTRRSFFTVAFLSFIKPPAVTMCHRNAGRAEKRK